VKTETGVAHQTGGLSATALLDLFSPSLSPDARSAAESLSNSLAEFGSDVIRSDDGEQTLRRPQQRMGAAITFEGGEQIPTLLVERPDGPAYNVAERIRDDAPGPVSIRVTGTAHSGWPESTVEAYGCSLQPGASIGHYAGWAGSLGCLVSLVSGRRSSVGVMGAAHVLANVGAGNPGDRILCPCPPDGPRSMASQIATLTDSTLLVHYKDSVAHARAVNTADAAIATLADQDHVPQANLVPDPADRRKKLRLKGHVAMEDLPRYEGQEVYKYGRTTGFRRGIYSGLTTESHSIRLPDNQIYFYRGTIMVQKIGRHAFSQPGDSGAPVYTREGLVLGLIVGAASDLTYISPMALCLNELKAEILK